MQTLLCWSGGKDSALALHELRRAGTCEPAGLLTTLNGGLDRVSMHGIPRALVEAQAAALDLPLTPVLVPPSDGAPAARLTAFPANAAYEAALGAALERARGNGVEAVAFGDICLEDLRAYREQLLANLGLRALFPLWGRESRVLMADVQRAGIRAVVVCVDAQKLDASWLGRELDATFVTELPPGVDPCGENGEFHTFVFDGPGFARAVPYERAAPVDEAGFRFLELCPAR